MFRALARQTGWVGIGIGGGQAAILIATPFLARIHEPAEFGALAVFLTVSNIATALGCARYDLALATAEPGLFAPLFRICVMLAVICGIFGMLAIQGIAVALPPSPILNTLYDNAAFAGACLALSAIHQAQSALLLRQGRVRTLAALRIVQGTGFALLGLTGQSSLIWAHTLSYVPSLALAFVSLTTPSGTGAGTITEVIRKHSDFPRLGLPGAVFDVVGYSLCIWVVIAVFGPAAGGEWSQIQRLVGAPLMLASMAVGQVLLVHSAQHRDDSAGLRRLFVQIELTMLMLLGGLVTVLLLAGENIIRAILGNGWQISAAFAIFVSVAVFVRAAVSPLTSVLVTFRRLDLGLRWQVAYFASASLTFALVAQHTSLLAFAAFYAVHETILYAIYLGLIFRVMKD